MSNGEFARFVADLKSSEALRAEAGKILPGASGAIPVEGVVAFATARGYVFTADEAMAAAAKALSDADLHGVVGGVAAEQNPLERLNVTAVTLEHVTLEQLNAIGDSSGSLSAEQQDFLKATNQFQTQLTGLLQQMMGNIAKNLKS